LIITSEVAAWHYSESVEGTTEKMGLWRFPAKQSVTAST